MKKLFLSFLIVLFFAVPSFAAPLDFFDGFEDGTTNNFDEQSCCAHSVEVQNTIKMTGEYAVKFFIDTGDYVSGSRRAELILENDAGSFLWISRHTEYWYVADYYIPSNFDVDTNRCYVFWQAHAGVGSPTISIVSSEDNIGYTGKGTHTNLRMSNRWGSVSSPQSTQYDLGLMTTYLGQWNHIVVHFYLTNNNDGYIEVWINNVKVVDQHNIPTHYDVTSGAYLKHGLYGAAAASVPVTTYIDNIQYVEGDFGLPTVTTQAVTDITTTTAAGHGTITVAGEDNCTKRGICWNTTGSPTVANDKVEEGGNFPTGAFSGNMTGLTPDQAYFARAYAYNTSGYGYGSTEGFNSDADANGTYIIDNGDAETSSTGTWNTSGGANPYGTDSLYCHAVNSTYTYEKTLDGNYTVSLWWTEWASRSSSVTVKIYDSGDNLLDTKSVNQTTLGSQWNEQDTYDFNATAKVVILSTGGGPPNVSTCADAVKFDYVEGSAGEDVNNPSRLYGINLQGCGIN